MKNVSSIITRISVSYGGNNTLLKGSESVLYLVHFALFCLKYSTLFKTLKTPVNDFGKSVLRTSSDNASFNIPGGGTTLISYHLRDFKTIPNRFFRAKPRRIVFLSTSFPNFRQLFFIPVDDQESESVFKDQAEDVAVEFFSYLLDEWKKRSENSTQIKKLILFLNKECSWWA